WLLLVSLATNSSRPNVYPLSLVVEMGTVVDVLKIRIEEFFPPPLLHRPQSIYLLYACDDRAISSPRLLVGRRFGPGATDVEKLRHLSQRQTVFQVVSDEPPLPLLGVGRLPTRSPYKALNPRGFRLGPRAAQARPHVLEAVGVGGKVDVAVDQRQ